MMTVKRKDALASIANRIPSPSNNMSESQDTSKDFPMPKNETDAMALYNTVEKLRMVKWLIVLMFVGYGIPTVLALLSGWKVYDFYMDPWVLTATIVSMTSGITYMMRNVLAVIFPTD